MMIKAKYLGMRHKRGSSASLLVAKPSVGSFRELRAATLTPGLDAEVITVVFIHFLQNSKTKDLRRRWKAFFRNPERLALPGNFRIVSIGFDPTELLRKGGEVLVTMCDVFLEYVRCLSASAKFIFLAHGIAGWIAKQSLSRFESSHIARRATIMFLGSMHNRASEWLSFAAIFLRQSGKRTTKDSETKQKPEGSLTATPPTDTVPPEFVSLKTYEFLNEVVNSNFDLMCRSINPVVRIIHSETFSIQEPGPPERRETRFSDLSRSSGASRHQFSIEQCTSPELSLMDIDSEPDVQRSIEYLIRSEMAKDPVQSAPNVSQENFPILLYTYNRAAQDPPAQLRSGAGQAAAKLSSAETPVRWSTGTYKAREKHADVFGPRLGRSTRRIVSMDAGMDASTAGMVKSRTQTRNQDRDLHDIQQTKLKVARLCHQCGQLEPARTLFEKLLIPESVGRPIEDLSFNIYIGSRIAEIHLHEGNYKKAEDCFLDLDTKCRALHQHNEVLVLEVSIGLANAFDKRGRFDEASKRLSDVKKRLAAMRNAEDQESQSQARREMLLMMTKNALGLVHAHQGSFMFAKKFNDEAQQMAKQSTKVNPAVSQHTTRIDFNSAEISVYSGRYEEAKEQIDDVARKLELQFGIRNLATLECRGLQAELLAVLNKTSEAEERAEQTLKHMRKEFGKQHPTTLRLLDTLASVYLSQGRIAEAMDIAEHVWDSNRTNPALKLHPKTHSIAESTHGGPCYLSEVRHLVLNSLVALNETETNHIESAHPQTIDSLHTLARAHRAAGSLRRAEYHQLVVVETSIRCLGVHHPRTVSYLSDLASVYCEMGRWEDSQQIILPVLRWQWKRFLQDAWQDEAETVSDTSMREQLSEKIVLVKKGLRSMDHAHPSLLSALHWLGIAERERANGDLSLSEVILEVVVKWRTQHLGEMHAETLLSRLERVKTYRKAGLISEAYGDLQKVLHLQEVHLGEVHPDTLSSRHELGIIFAFQGQFTQAAKEHLMVQQLRTKLLGPQHLYTLHSQLELSHDYHQLGELRKSRDLLHAALRIQLQHLKKPDPGVRIYNEDEWDQTFARLLELALPDSSELELNATAETPYTVTYSSFISSIVALVSLNVTSASANSMETQPKEKPTPSNDSSLLAATNLQECLVDLQRLSYGDDAEQTLQSLNDLALLYQDQERWNAAKKLYKKVQKKLPASHRLCLAAQSNLATLYFQEGKLEAAEALQETVVAELEQAYPLDRTTLIESTFNLALTRRRLTERAGQPPDMSLMNDIRDMSEQLGHMHPLYLTIYETWEEWNRGDT